MAAEPGFRYWAFISYSTRDQRWAQWLLKALETYRVPKRLVGQPSRDGGVPKRLYPNFRDRDELPTSGDLGQAIESALEQSRYLVVVCSPASARSHWVDAEVRTFKRLGRANRILCLIVEGEPNATARGASDRECFCPALRHGVDVQGNVTAERVEPMGADAQPHMDGRSAALIKVIAGLLGVNYDELRQRERKRRIVRRMVGGAVAFAVLGALATGWQLRQQALLHESLRAAQEALAMVAADQNDAALRRLDAAAPARAASIFTPFPVETAAALALALERNRLQLVLRGMRRETDAIDFSPEGGRILTASRDNVMRIWDAASGALLGAVGHPATRDRPWRAAWLDTDRFITAGDDGIVRLCSRSSAQPLQAVSAHGAPISAFALHRASGRFATASTDGAVLLWNDLAARKELARSGSAVSDLAFSADGRRIAAAAQDGIIRIWDTERGRLLATLGEERSVGLPIHSVRLDAKGERVVAASESRDAILWTLGDGRHPKITRLAHEREVWFADFDPAGGRVATASADRTARLWNAKTGQPLGAPMPHGQAVRHLAFSPDGTILATASHDNAVHLWSARDATPIPGGVLRGHRDFALRVAFDASGRRIASASSDMTVRVWNATAEPRAAVLRGHSGPVRRARWSANGSRIVTAGEDGRVILWDGASGAEAKRLPRFDVSVYGAEFDRQGNRVVLALRDRTARVWNLASDAMAVLRGHGGAVTHASFDPSGAFIATVTIGGDNSLRIFDANTGLPTSVRVQEEPLHRPLWSAVFHADGRRILVAAQAEQAFIWDKDNPAARVELKGHRRALNWAAFDPSGRLVVTASDDGTARLWDAASGRHLRSLEPHEDFVLAAAFSPDGERVATATRRGIVRFWRVSDGGLLAIRHTPGAVPVYSLDFSPDGAKLLAGLDDGSARLLETDIDPQKLLDRLRQLRAITAP